MPFDSVRATRAPTTDTGHKALCPVSLTRTQAYYGRVPGILWGKGHKEHTMVGSGVGILKWCIHTLLTLTRGHITTVRGVTGSPCARSTWTTFTLVCPDSTVTLV